MASSDPPIRWGVVFGGHQFFVVRLQFKADLENNIRPYIVVSERTPLDSPKYPIIALVTYILLKEDERGFDGTDDISDSIPVPVSMTRRSLRISDLRNRLPDMTEGDGSNRAKGGGSGRTKGNRSGRSKSGRSSRVEHSGGQDSVDALQEFVKVRCFRFESITRC
jgi:hypothetical protein